VTTKTRLSAIEALIGHGAPPRKSIQEMTNEELSEIAGTDLRKLYDDELLEIINEGTAA
jgi:hypothetical protein